MDQASFFPGSVIGPRRITGFLQVALCLSIALAVSGLRGAQAQANLAPPGFLPPNPLPRIIQAKRVYVRPDSVLEEGQILFHQGKILEVGKSVSHPPGVVIQDYGDATIYAGFLEMAWVSSSPSKPETRSSEDNPVYSSDSPSLYRFFGEPGEELDPGLPGPSHSLSTVHPDFQSLSQYTPRTKDLEPLHKNGFTSAVLFPDHGIFKGQSSLLALRMADPSELILKPSTFQHLELSTAPSGFPNSLMGTVSVIRQTFLEAEYHRNAQEYRAKHPGSLAEDRVPPSLQPILSPTSAIFVVEPKSILMQFQMEAFFQEWKRPYLILGSGHEWRRPDLLTHSSAPLILPLTFPKIDKLERDEAWDALTLEQLRAWDWAPETASLVQKSGRPLVLTTYGLSDAGSFRANLRHAVDRGLTPEQALQALTLEPARQCGVESFLGSIEPGKGAFFTVVEKDGFFDPRNKVLSVWVQGHHQPVEPAPLAFLKKKSEKEKEAEKKEDESPSWKRTRNASSPLLGRAPLAQPNSILVRNVTAWTSGPAGILKSIDIHIQDGVIRRIAGGIKLSPEEAKNTWIIDGSGKHMTPGLIDAHSHGMILGGVNESTLPSSAMVRIQDVVDADSRNILLQLAGGLTVANLLHGSANPIGGQNCVIKLREGESPHGLVFKEAPSGIKFALGENVKQSNWGDSKTSRFPQTRMGVPVFIQNRFEAARQYLQRQSETKPDSAPQWIDLELETLGEIIQGKRLIHCHSYRQDEILAFLRVMESFNVRVGTLQHVLEGYKVADEIAAHGAGASCFADWWAYKFEVIDAIPYAGAIMHQRNVLVSFNSDSADLARRMNLESAKAVKYGNVPESEALQFVTLNPARQLGIDQYVGSLEVGKQADFAIWSDSPLNTASLCLETWIEGKKYFDREEHAKMAETFQSERKSLLDKVKLATGASSNKDGEDSKNSSQKETEEKDPAYLSWQAYWNLYEIRDRGHEMSCGDCGTHDHQHED